MVSKPNPASQQFSTSVPLLNGFLCLHAEVSYVSIRMKPRARVGITRPAGSCRSAVSFAGLGTSTPKR